mgnify:FL=1
MHLSCLEKINIIFYSVRFCALSLGSNTPSTGRMEKSVESNANQAAADPPTDLEEFLKHHCMMGVYQHETVDEATGM